MAATGERLPSATHTGGFALFRGTNPVGTSPEQRVEPLERRQLAEKRKSSGRSLFSRWHSNYLTRVEASKYAFL